MVGGPRAVRLGFWYRFAVAVLHPVLRVLTRRDWRGAENLPRTGGVVVVANHVSHLDPLTLGHFLWDNGRAPRYLGKEGLFRAPVLGALVRACGQIPVRRESDQAGQAYAVAVAAVRRGECVGIYPEGTITRDPDGWPMTGKTGAARVAMETGCPVVPVAHWGAQEVLPAYALWPRLFPRKTIHVVAGPPVPLDDLRRLPPTADVLREATERLMAAITLQLAEIRGLPAPAGRFDPRLAGVPLTGNPRRRRPGRRDAARPGGRP